MSGRMRRFWGMGSAVALVLLAAGVAVAGVARSGRKHPTHGAACVSTRGVLALQSHGRCAAALTRVSVPLGSATGPRGAPGPQGPPGLQGPQGAAGGQGPAGPVTGKAPAGLTSTGPYDIDEYYGGILGLPVGTAITFPFELTGTPTVVVVPNAGPNPDATHCVGTADAPAAAPGYLCVYELHTSGISGALEVREISDVPGANRFGARLVVTPAIDGNIWADGSWAVTAP